jgi:hypothetical protein
LEATAWKRAQQTQQRSAVALGADEGPVTDRVQREVADHKVRHFLQIPVVPHPLDELEHHFDLVPEVVGSRATVSSRDESTWAAQLASDVAANHLFAGNSVWIKSELPGDGQ